MGGCMGRNKKKVLNALADTIVSQDKQIAELTATAENLTGYLSDMTENAGVMVQQLNLWRMGFEVAVGRLVAHLGLEEGDWTSLRAEILQQASEALDSKRQNP